MVKNSLIAEENGIKLNNKTKVHWKNYIYLNIFAQNMELIGEI